MRRPASILGTVTGILVGRTRAGRIGRATGLAAVAGLCGATVMRRRRARGDVDESDEAVGGAAHVSPGAGPSGESADADRIDQHRSANGSVPGDRRSPLEGSGSVADPRAHASEADLLESQPVTEDDGEPEFPEDVPTSGSEADVIEQLRSAAMDEEERR